MVARSFVSPEPGDDFAAIAARVLPDTDDAADQVLSWNLHLAARVGAARVGAARVGAARVGAARVGAARVGPGRPVGLLPSDIVFTEPPPAP